MKIKKIMALALLLSAIGLQMSGSVHASHIVKIIIEHDFERCVVAYKTESK